MSGDDELDVLTRRIADCLERHLPYYGFNPYRYVGRRCFWSGREGTSMSDGEAIEAAVNEAIEKVIRDHEGGFTIRWVALVETAGPDGSRGVWTMTSPDVKAWDTLGLLEYGKQLQVRGVLNGGDE